MIGEMTKATISIVNIEIIVRIIDYCNLRSELPLVSVMYLVRNTQLNYLITAFPLITEK